MPFFSPPLSHSSQMMTSMNTITLSLFLFFFTIFHVLIQPASAGTCRFYCGNITVAFPFTLQAGCGHPGFRDLLYCMNGVLMLHIPSGSYRVLDIDYAYHAITLHDPVMSDCYSLTLHTSGNSPKGNGFVVEPWRAPYLTPAADNVFLLLGCRAESPLFEGFPERHLPCRNVSGMGCEEYYACPAWSGLRPRSGSSAYGSTNPPECCSVAFGEIRSINLSRLGCQGYSSAYNTAPLRPPGPGVWSYGIRTSYSVPADHNDFCRSCEATSGACGYDMATDGNLCLCNELNSTSNCDSGTKLSTIL